MLLTLVVLGLVLGVSGFILLWNVSKDYPDIGMYVYSTARIKKKQMAVRIVGYFIMVLALLILSFSIFSFLNR